MAQGQVLEMIVRGHPLGEVLGALCGIVEREAPSPVHAVMPVPSRHREDAMQPVQAHELVFRVDRVPSKRR